MNMRADFDAKDLSGHLLERLFQNLRGLRDLRPGGFHSQGDRLFTYSALSRERIAAITLPYPLIGVVLRGHKEVWLGDLCEDLPAGSLFALPAGVALDVVNTPSERSGVYESLIFEIAALPASVAALPQPPLAAWTGPRSRLALTADLVEAVAHAAAAIASATAREQIKDLRLAEMLSLMRADPAARHLFTRRLADELALRMAAEPDRDWSVDGAAAMLGLGGSTLRRRLGREGTSFRAVLTGVRMDAARRLLMAGEPSGRAALASGYVSRSHFARAYRSAFGILPRDRDTEDGAGQGGVSAMGETV